MKSNEKSMTVEERIKKAYSRYNKKETIKYIPDFAKYIYKFATQEEPLTSSFRIHRGYIQEMLLFKMPDADKKLFFNTFLELDPRLKNLTSFILDKLIDADFEYFDFYVVGILLREYLNLCTEGCNKLGFVSFVIDCITDGIDTFISEQEDTNCLSEEDTDCLSEEDLCCFRFWSTVDMFELILAHFLENSTDLDTVIQNVINENL